MIDASDGPAPAPPGRGASVLAIDVGGTDLKAAILTESGNLLTVIRRPTPRRRDDPARGIVQAVAQLSMQFREQGFQIDAIGVTIPGIVDEDSGIGIASTNLGWRDVPFRDLLEDATGMRVAVAHDVRAAGAAEYRLGAARGARDAAVVTVGTGIAAALILGGAAYRGGGYAGEIGHSVVDPLGPPCLCGQRGCLEAIGSASAIVRRYTERSGAALHGAHEVVALVESGDPLAAQVWEEALDALATGLAQLSAIVAPEVIVIGGGLSEAGDVLLVPLRHRMEERRTHGRTPSVVRAALGQDAGIWGAALAARDRCGVHA